jgi:hypothetical protein
MEEQERSLRALPLHPLDPHLTCLKKAVSGFLDGITDFSKISWGLNVSEQVAVPKQQFSARIFSPSRIFIFLPLILHAFPRSIRCAARWRTQNSAAPSQL